MKGREVNEREINDTLDSGTDKNQYWMAVRFISVAIEWVWDWDMSVSKV